VIYDRRKDLIISGGENIYPYEIETIAKTHKEINDAVCIAKEDATWGQVPVLYYVSERIISNTELILSPCCIFFRNTNSVINFFMCFSNCFYLIRINIFPKSSVVGKIFILMR
jgi:hypothetical protein